MVGGRRSTDRAISPVVGVAILVVVVAILATTAGAMLYGLADPQPSPPSARLAVEQADRGCGYYLVHRGGEAVDGEQVTVRGVADSNAVGERTLAAGDRVRIDPRQQTVEVVWTSADGASGYVLARSELSEAALRGVDWACVAGTVFTSDPSGLVAVAGDNGSVVSLSAASSVQALGPTDTDVTGDGTDDIPFIDGSGAITLTDDSNQTTTLATDSDIAGSIETDKTRLGVGTWNGSGESVFFVNDNHDTIYRVAPGGTPQQVATPGNGAQAVVGPGDIDGDGDAELIFADGSQQLRYLEPGGAIGKIDDGGTGSNQGIGAGSVVDLDGDGTVSVVTIDGSNDLKIAGEATSDGGEGKTIVSAVDAEKTVPTAADVDGDGELELVFVGKSDEKLRYLDDVGGANTVELLRDEDGDEVGGSPTTGVV